MKKFLLLLLAVFALNSCEDENTIPDKYVVVVWREWEQHVYHDNEFETVIEHYQYHKGFSGVTKEFIDDLENEYPPEWHWFAIDRYDGIVGGLPSLVRIESRERFDIEVTKID